MYPCGRSTRTRWRQPLLHHEDRRADGDGLAGRDRDALAGRERDVAHARLVGAAEILDLERLADVQARVVARGQRIVEPARRRSRRGRSSSMPRGGSGCVAKSSGPMTSRWWPIEPGSALFSRTVAGTGTAEPPSRVEPVSRRASRLSSVSRARASARLSDASVESYDRVGRACPPLSGCRSNRPRGRRNRRRSDRWSDAC